MDKQKLVIGFITYGNATFKYLPDFVGSLKNQSYQDFAVLVLDNSSRDDQRNSDYLKQNLPQAEIVCFDNNLGFAKGANKLIAHAKAKQAEYFFLVNPDTCLDERVLEKLVEFSFEHPEITAVSPKVLRWDFANKTKTNIIDTCGLALRPGFKFVDVGQGQKDEGQFNQGSILGPSGCSAFFNLKNLGLIKFDERFFMYKEDCDLAYQFWLAGKKCLVAPQALVYHDRTIARGPRSAKGKLGKQWSFCGQQLLIFKYWQNQSWWSKAQIIWREIFMLAYVVLFEPYLLRELKPLVESYKVIKFRN